MNVSEVLKLLVFVDEEGDVSVVFVDEEGNV